MAVTLSTLKTEVTAQARDTATTGALTDSNDFLYWVNEYYDLYENEMQLESRVTYTWPASQTSVALTTVSSTLITVERIENLDDDNNVAGQWVRGPKDGEESTFFIFADTLYLNGTTTGPSEALSQIWYCYRKATRATSINDNADVHSGYERSVLKPWFLAKLYEKRERFATADGYYRQFEHAFKRMMLHRYRQYRPKSETWEPAPGYEPLTG